MKLFHKTNHSCIVYTSLARFLRQNQQPSTDQNTKWIFIIICSTRIQRNFAGIKYSRSIFKSVKYSFSERYENDKKKPPRAPAPASREKQQWFCNPHPINKCPADEKLGDCACATCWRDYSNNGIVFFFFWFCNRGFVIGDKPFIEGRG